MAAEIIEDDDIAGLERGDQELFDISEKALAVDRSIDHDWRVDPIMAQRCEEGQRLPMTVWHLGMKPFASRTATMGPHHVSLRPGLVDEHETPGIEPTLITLPARPPAGNIMPFLFGWQYAFF